MAKKPNKKPVERSAEKPARKDRRIFRRRARSWQRLDNAAKIFPSSNFSTNTCVFRFSATIDQPVDPVLLQKAVDKAIARYPSYLVVMKSGMFWYYLEETDLRPVVVPEKKPVAAPLYDENRPGLLFEVSYFKDRINLEVFHVLTDGTGAVSFLRTITYYYLMFAYPDQYESSPPALPDEGSAAGRSSDSFRKYYKPVRRALKDKSKKRPWNIRLPKSDREYLQVIEGVAPVDAVLHAAHRYNTTMTVYLTALFMKALRQEMPVSAEKRPVVLGVPVNLRSYFPSETARNFFGMIDVAYSFAERDGELSDIIAEVARAFKEELTRDRLEIRMNTLAALEHNLVIQLVPLPLKNLVLRFVKLLTDRSETAVLSNVGKAVFPPEMMEHLKLMSVFASTLKLQLTLVSCGNNLSFGFTSAYDSTDIQKNFFRLLTEAGIPVEIRSNDFYAGEEDNDAAM